MNNEILCCYIKCEKSLSYEKDNKNEEMIQHEQ